MLFSENFVFVQENFFKNPYKVIELSKNLKYLQKNIYPGQRTENLLFSSHDIYQNLGKYVVTKILSSILYGVENLSCDIRFHKNFDYGNNQANLGWIHNDECDFTGIIFLNPNESSIKTGTSFFDAKNKSLFKNSDVLSRLAFNKTNNVTEEYLKDLETNHNSFQKTNCIGNKFNRFVIFNGQQWHSPTSFDTTSKPRLSMLIQIKINSTVNLKSLNKILYNYADE